MRAGVFILVRQQDYSSVREFGIGGGTGIPTRACRSRWILSRARRIPPVQAIRGLCEISSCAPDISLVTHSYGTPFCPLTPGCQAEDRQRDEAQVGRLGDQP